MPMAAIFPMKGKSVKMWFYIMKTINLQSKMFCILNYSITLRHIIQLDGSKLVLSMYLNGGYHRLFDWIFLKRYSLNTDETRIYLL